MMSGLAHIIRLVLLITVQIVAFNQLELFNRVNPQVYIYFLLVLPMGIHRAWLLVMGFLLGLLMDGFNNTAGLHAVACTMVAYFRPFLLRRIVDEPEEIFNNLNLNQLSFTVIGVYFLSMILIHHTVIYFVEVLSLQYFWRTLKILLLSTAITLVISMILRYSLSWYGGYRRG